MDITEVLGGDMPMSDVPLDTQSLDLDNELSVDALNKLVTEVESEVLVTNFVVKATGDTNDSGGIFVQETNVIKSDPRPGHLVSTKSCCDNVDSDSPSSSSEFGVRRRNDGTLVKVTSTSLISGIIKQPTGQVADPGTVVVNMYELNDYICVNLPTTVDASGFEPLPVQEIPLDAQQPESSEQATTVNSVLLPSYIQPSQSPQAVIYYMCKCPNCDLLTNTKDLLVKHIEDKHAVSIPTGTPLRNEPTPNRPYKCNFEGCKWSFDSQPRLNRHLITHTEVKPFECPEEGCGRAFTTKANLNSHLKIGHDPKRNKIICAVAGCDKTFKFKKYMEEHLQKQHPMLKRFVCTIAACKKTFISQEDMNNHITKAHSRTLICTICGKRFHWVSRYTEHMDMHSGRRPHKCPFKGCDWSFGTISRLRRHEKIHTVDRPFTCHWEGCTSAFYRKEHLRAHVNSEHNQLKPFRCPIENCRSQFTSKSGLLPHLRKHYTQGSKTVYNCPFESCPKQCSTEETLRYHIQSHISQGDPRILKILEARDDINKETLVGLRLAEKSQIPGRPRTLLPIILSTLQTCNFGIEQPYQFLQQAALEAAVKVQVNALEPISLTSTGDDTVATTFENIADTSPIPCTSQSDSNKLSADILYSEVEHGSARTDYIVNHLSSEHARTRRRLLKENGNLIGVVSLQNLVRVRSVTQETVVEELDDEEDGEGEDFETEIEGFNLNELLRAPDMTLRDPETGVSYDQTQLLQDDPPIPMSA